MIQIRKGCFETNSSSVHALVIPDDQTISIPTKVTLYSGEYGWENEEYGDTLNYFYQACVDQGRAEVDRFFNYLKSKGIEEIHAPELHWTKYKDFEYVENNDGWVDHSGEIPFDELFANEHLLDSFLFGSGAYVHTGNDNSDLDWAEELKNQDDVTIIWKYN